MKSSLFQVSTALDVDVTALRLVGVLDLDSVAQLRAAVADCWARRSRRVVIDLRDLRFCDCAGLGVLLEARDTADKVGTELCVEGARAQVARLFALTGVDDLISGSVPRLPPRTV
nr:STAS domain-containing protein [Streptomyces sp. NBC_00974]